MASQKTYADKLKDPRWQKKRLDILQRDGFKCRACGDVNLTLHVHHVRYESDCDPWDYESDDLITLCECCHEVWHIIDKHCDWAAASLVSQLYNELEYQSFSKFCERHNKEKINNDLNL